MRRMLGLLLAWEGEEECEDEEETEPWCCHDPNVGRAAATRRKRSVKTALHTSSPPAEQSLHRASSGFSHTKEVTQSCSDFSSGS